MVGKTVVIKHWLFIVILLVAIVLRLYKLGTVPVGLSWDEAAIGYNGYGIAVVHRDEWLKKLPITFKSFGDYKAATAIYLDAVSTTVFGLTPFAIRFPMALAGVVTVLASYWIAKYVFQERSAALLTMFLVAVSPWNIHYSRIAFESGVAVAIVAIGVVAFLYAKKYPWVLYPISACFFILSIYTYHSTKITAPFLAVLLFVAVYLKEKRKHWKQLIFAGVIGLILLFPLAKETLNGQAGERFFMTSAILENNKLKNSMEIMKTLSQNLVLHLDPRFLLFGKTDTYRHGNGMFGVFGYVEFLLFLVGVVTICFVPGLQGKKHKESIRLKWLCVAVVIALIPAVISTGAPHSNRTHGMIPWIQLIAAYGYMWMHNFVRQKKHVQNVLMVFVAGITALSTVLYAIEYLRIYQTAAAKNFQYGYAEAIETARAHESQVHSILFTSAYGQPYIYILLGKKLTPIQWQQGALANYELRDIDWEKDGKRSNILIVGTPEEIPEKTEHIVKEVRYPTGEVAFRIVKLP